MLYRFFARTKGAVSVFLAVILIPMMFISSLYVDAGKIKLGKAVAESAGDLTLNTALTDYDTDLKDLYGLMATAQDTSDLFSRLEDYFTTCITSSGVYEEDAKFFAQEIVGSLKQVEKSNDVSDVMNMQVVDFSVGALENANLMNPAILKKQIVDFMKYRAPIDAGLSFISAIKTFKTLQKQTDLIDKKKDYYEKQQSMMEDLQEAWANIAAYNGTSLAKEPNWMENVSKNMKAFMDGGELSGIQGETRTIKGLFNGTLHNDNTLPISDHAYIADGIMYRTVWDLYDILSRGDDFWKFEYNFTYESDKPVTYEIPNGTEEADIVRYYIPGETLIVPCDTVVDFCNKYKDKSEELPTAEDFHSVIESYFTLSSVIDECLQYFKNEEPRVDYGDDDYSLRFYYNAVVGDPHKTNIKKFASKVAELYVKYHHLWAMVIWLDGYDEDDAGKIDKNAKITVKKDGKNVTNSIDAFFSEVKRDYEDKMNLNGNCYKIINRFYNLVHDNPSNGPLKLYDLSYRTVFTELDTITNEARDYRTQLTTAKESLSGAISYLESAKTKLGGELATAEQSWSRAANDKEISDTSLAKQDTAEINQLNKYINAENIDKLVTRLRNVLEKVIIALEQVEGNTINEEYIGDIESVEDLCDLYGKFNNNEDTFRDGISQSTQRQAVYELVNKTLRDIHKSEEVAYDWVKEQGRNPNLNQDKVTLYAYLESHFGVSVMQSGGESNGDTPSSEVKEKDDTNGEDFYKSIKETSKKTANDQVSGAGKENNGDDSKSELSGIEGIPSKVFKQTTNGGDSDDDENAGEIDTDPESGTKNASAKIGGIFGAGVLDAIAGFGEDLRDNLYVSEYVMNMFSYDTIEKEYKKTHGETEPVKLETLTKCPVSAEKNYAFRNEVEYILYGGTYASNKAKAYASIFGIRFGFDLIYAFATSEIRDSAFAIATPISAATLGIIPVPLIQAVIIIGMACCEAGLDVLAISEGEKVPLYKTSESWSCSISGLLRTAKDKIADTGKVILKKAADEVIDYGVDQLNELLDSADSWADDEIEQKQNDLETAISNIYNSAITENANQAIQYLTTLANTAIEEAFCALDSVDLEKKIADAKASVREKMRDWGAQFTGDDIASTVKREAVNVILDKGGNIIDRLIDELRRQKMAPAKPDDREKDINNIIPKIEDLSTEEAAKNAVDQLGGQAMNLITELRNVVVNQVGKAGGAVSKLKDELTVKIRDSIARGGDDLKDTVGGFIDNLGGSGDGGFADEDAAGSGAAAFFSFAYSDYIEMFLLIKMFTNEEKVLLRMADVIQVNMAECNGKSGYTLSNSVVYVKLHADIQVKPTLIAAPIFADIAENPAGNANWYSFSYDGYAGY